jgi:hypothetical protein
VKKLREHFTELFTAQEAKKQQSGCSSMVEQRPLKPLVAGSSPAAPAKYKNTATDGFASKKEAKRAAELARMQRVGLIRNLGYQRKFVLIPRQEGERECAYIADFVYEEGPLWTLVVEDVKGYPDQKWPIKRKLMLIVHGIRVRVT